MGAPATPSGSRASHEARADLHPSGFDPSRTGVFLKRAIAIDAWQFHNDASGYDLLGWANQQQYAAGREFVRWINDKLHIPTLEGVMQASVGDWIIRGLRGELYPCKPDIFALTYERIGDLRDASAIEARSGETQSGSTEGESATRQGDAQ